MSDAKQWALRQSRGENTLSCTKSRQLQRIQIEKALSEPKQHQLRQAHRKIDLRKPKNVRIRRCRRILLLDQCRLIDGTRLFSVSKRLGLCLQPDVYCFLLRLHGQPVIVYLYQKKLNTNDPGSLFKKAESDVYQTSN